MNAEKSFNLPKDFGYQLGLIGFTRLSNILRLLHFSIGIHPRYGLRLLLVIISSLITLPLRLWETIACGSQIAKIEIDRSPVFIIGYWRSGTTHLHNLMTQDKTFGYLSMYQAMVPDCSLVGQSWLKPLLSKIVPLKRPMDNMTWPVDAPQEEEFPLAKMMPHSFYINFLFPRKTLYLFKKYVLMEGAPQRAIDEFKQKYYKLLQIATLHANNKPLILKNPVNTARVRLLLEMFPEAKFIHIYRSPYDIFASSQNLHHTLSQLTTLQVIDPANADETVLSLYEEMMKRFLLDRESIADRHLVEVRFEDLERDPIAELSRIYQTLDLEGFDRAEPAFKAYIDSQKSYKKNNFNLSVEDCKRVEQRWGFAFSSLNYPLQYRSDC
jgi:omega-hydroxy-beta-dihydromenaquinone-9 sulfotransferase